MNINSKTVSKVSNFPGLDRDKTLPEGILEGRVEEGSGVVLL